MRGALLTFVFSIIFFLFQGSLLCDSKEVIDYASEAYDYSREAYHADTLEDAEYYSKKAMSAAEDAISAASEIGNSDAEYYATEAYDYSRKAYYADTLEDAEYYSKKAMSAAEDAQMAAEDFEEEEY